MLLGPGTKCRTLKIRDTRTLLVLVTDKGTNRNVLTNKYVNLDILTKNNNKTEIRHNFVGDFAN